MNQLPVPMDRRPMLEVPSRGPDTDRQAELPVAHLWGIVRRHWLLIALCTAITVGSAISYAVTATPIYQGATTLRIDEKKGNLPDVLQPFGAAGEVVTELEVLRSRSLVEDAARELGLQVVLREPERLSRSVIMSDVLVGDSVSPGLYRFTRRADGKFVVTDTNGANRTPY